MNDVAEDYKMQVGDFLEQAEETKLKIDMVMVSQQSEHLN
jgi:hypothetical protein